MKIIIEGCDGTGKTTVAKVLAQKYNLDLVHFTSEDPKDDLFYKQSLRKENIVYDRNYLGELVYPKIFNRTPGDNISLESIREYLDQNKDIKFFIFTADNSEIKNRLSIRGNENNTVLSNIENINNMFIEIGKKLNIPIIDTGKNKPGDVIKIIERNL